jgi:hypothetical protein
MKKDVLAVLNLFSRARQPSDPIGGDMADESQLHNLEVRIAKLEDQLSQERAARETLDISDDDLRGFLKVRWALRQEGGSGSTRASHYLRGGPAPKPCAPVVILVSCSTDEEEQPFSDFLRLSGTEPVQEPPPKRT